ncbi:MAG TPA: sulfatase [Opitutae bacterium]|nr:sulfatase [Opitutae bacterium]
MKVNFLFPFLALGCLAAAKKPNILFIFTDDHAPHAIGAYGSKLIETPNLDRIAREGMTFDRCYVTNSICAPARAVILSGRHSFHNGQMTNGDVFDGSQVTFPKLLRKAGYETALIGKWHLKSDPTGFDRYEVLYGQGSYYNPRMKKDGKEVKHVGYTTDIITDLSLKWLKEERDPDKPFMLMSQHKAPHGRWEPALRHLGALDDVEIPEPKTLFDDYAGRTSSAREHKMGILEHLGDARLMLKYSSKFTPEQFKVFDGYFRPRNESFLAKRASMNKKELTRWHYQRWIRNYLLCAKAVDENVGRLLQYLDESGLAKDTVVIYASDQGFYLGDHGWFDKRWMYELSYRMPLLVRWPGTVRAKARNGDLTSNLDFAQTFLDLAGAKADPKMQGKSLLPLLKGKTPGGWRESLYYHYHEGGGHGVARHEGVKTARHKLIHFYEKKEWELFDLEKDPDEMKSVYGNPAYAKVQDDLLRELERLKQKHKVPAHAYRPRRAKKKSP